MSKQTKTIDQKMQEVWDRQEIEQLMYRHARSLDRMDAELMKSCYWEEGVEELEDPMMPENLSYNGSAWDFVPGMMDGFKMIKRTQHRISNIYIELDGNKANAESYVWAYNLYDVENVEKETIVGGRHYFDLEKRDDEWRILHRVTSFDWNQNNNSTGIWSENRSDKYKAKRNFTGIGYYYVETHKRK